MNGAHGVERQSGVVLVSFAGSILASSVAVAQTLRQPSSCDLSVIRQSVAAANEGDTVLLPPGQCD